MEGAKIAWKCKIDFKKCYFKLASIMLSIQGKTKHEVMIGHASNLIRAESLLLKRELDREIERQLQKKIRFQVNH